MIKVFAVIALAAFICGCAGNGKKNGNGGQQPVDTYLDKPEHQDEELKETGGRGI